LQPLVLVRAFSSVVAPTVFHVYVPEFVGTVGCVGTGVVTTGTLDVGTVTVPVGTVVTVAEVVGALVVVVGALVVVDGALVVVDGGGDEPAAWQ
jgi:hypothetical protein